MVLPSSGWPCQLRELIPSYGDFPVRRSFRSLGILSLACTMFVAAPAEAKLSKQDKIAIKEATVGCKAKARGQKLGWFASRKYVRSCVAEALKDHPHIDVMRLDLDHPGMRELPTQHVKDPI